MDFLLKPKILTHPNIPKPLHGLSPRTIMGKEWWDIERIKVYRRYNYCCIACGVSKYKAKVHQWLEAHEYWRIDYSTGECEVMSIEPLCHYCHNFIHSGRLGMIIGKEKSIQDAINILEHGFKILADNHLYCFPNTLDLADMIGANTFNVRSYSLPSSLDIEWNKWVLIFDGQKYYSKFASYSDWLKHYQEE